MYIGVDVGGTKTGIASFSNLDHPNILEKISLPTEQNYAKATQVITAAIEKLGHNKVEAIGLGTAGALDKKKTQVLHCSAYPDWSRRPLKKDLEENLRCPVVIENDATAAAIGEAVYGHGKGKNFIFIIWGTGIGGTEVRNKNGKVETFSFEPGHQVVIANGELDDCGQRGCLEAYCGGKALARRYGVSPEEMTENQWREVLEIMAQGMLNVFVIRPTKLVVFGGGVACKQQRRLEKLNLILKEKMTFLNSPDRIFVTKFGEDAGLYGALALLKNN